jgi:hypothetical protein
MRGERHVAGITYQLSARRAEPEPRCQEKEQHSRHFRSSILRFAFLFVDCDQIAALQQVDFEKLMN